MRLYTTCRAFVQNGEKTNRTNCRSRTRHLATHCGIRLDVLDLAVTRGIVPRRLTNTVLSLSSVDMFFDRESTVVITKLGNLPETALISYCRKFGNVIRCLIKTNTQAKMKEPCKCTEKLCQRRRTRSQSFVVV